MNPYIHSPMLLPSRAFIHFVHPQKRPLWDVCSLKCDKKKTRTSERRNSIILFSIFYNNQAIHFHIHLFHFCAEYSEDTQFHFELECMLLFFAKLRETTSSLLLSRWVLISRWYDTMALLLCCIKFKANSFTIMRMKCKIKQLWLLKRFVNFNSRI